ncbi:MAG: cytochrome c oxidase subunit II [Hyphomicrobiales bacterium]|nr:cytochrome c oxidase subunit II [Hyphomicrobiales bacterium]
MTSFRIATRNWLAGGISAAMLFAAGAAHAEFVGTAKPGQIGLPEAVTEQARDMIFFHDAILLPIITVISLLVLILLIIVMNKFKESSNPVPSRTTHNAALEVAWTVVPIMILLFIAAFSFPLLNKQLILPKADHTLKVTGNASWAWTWTYPKEEGGGFEFTSRLLDQNNLPKGKLKLLDVDNEAVVPVNKVIRVQVTADVVGIIHSFTIPNFGVRIDAVPGRLNEIHFKAEKEGVYYGQCSKICGKDHAYMPVVIRVVSEEKYKQWLADAKKKFAEAPAKVRFAAVNQ